jgi:ubiquitin carboxyl-terminal hydrolase 34
VEAFVDEKIFKHGPTPVFEETSGGPRRAQAVITTARQLAVNILYYLRDAYVAREVQAARDTVQPFSQLLQQCDAYFQDREDLGEELSQQYHELRQCMTPPQLMHLRAIECFTDS